MADVIGAIKRTVTKHPRPVLTPRLIGRVAYIGSNVCRPYLYNDSSVDFTKPSAHSTSPICILVI
jgi:hypothetical protein